MCIGLSNNALNFSLIYLHHGQITDKSQKVKSTQRENHVRIRIPTWFSLVAEAGFEPTTFGL